MLAPFPLNIWGEDQGLYKCDWPPTEQGAIGIKRLVREVRSREREREREKGG